jgi:hypothetical protein
MPIKPGTYTEAYEKQEVYRGSSKVTKVTSATLSTENWKSQQKFQRT